MGFPPPPIAKPPNFSHWYIPEGQDLALDTDLVRGDTWRLIQLGPEDLYTALTHKGKEVLVRFTPTDHEHLLPLEMEVNWIESARDALATREGDLERAQQCLDIARLLQFEDGSFTTELQALESSEEDRTPPAGLIVFEKVSCEPLVYNQYDRNMALLLGRALGNVHKLLYHIVSQNPFVDAPLGIKEQEAVLRRCKRLVLPPESQEAWNIRAYEAQLKAFKDLIAQKTFSFGPILGNFFQQNLMVHEARVQLFNFNRIAHHPHGYDVAIHLMDVEAHENELPISLEHYQYHFFGGYAESYSEKASQAYLIESLKAQVDYFIAFHRLFEYCKALLPRES